ncbi:MAG: ABC transporter permease [Planctomycetota bacterium]|jgi:ABC-2 type transport system permease protein
MMLRTLKVAQREYIETVKTKTFLISLFIAPLIIAGIVFFTRRMVKDKGGPRRALNVAVTDLTQELSEQIRASFEAYNESSSAREIKLHEVASDVESFEKTAEEQKERLRQRQLDVYVVVEKDVISGSGKMVLHMYGTKVSNFDAPFKIESLINQAVRNHRCKLQNVSPDLLAELRRRVPTEHVEVGSASDEERVQKRGKRIAEMMVPFFFMYMMFLGVLLAAQPLLTSIIEEKSSRVVEVLLSAVSPFELMAGKILGLGGIGLTVVALWSGAAYLGARWQGINVEVGSGLLVYFAVYYILGFLLFSSILAGVGSICNTLKEAQSLMMPVTLIFILPLMSWFNLAKHPEGSFAKILSFVPPLTPLVMVLRLSAGSDTLLLEVLASILLLAASVVVAMWAGAKLFRTGILMYGKRPGLREILRWLKHR